VGKGWLNNTLLQHRRINRRTGGDRFRQRQLEAEAVNRGLILLEDLEKEKSKA